MKQLTHPVPVYLLSSRNHRAIGDGGRSPTIALLGSLHLAPLAAPADGVFLHASPKFCHANIAHRDRTAWLGKSDSNSEMLSQSTLLKSRADFLRFS